MRHTGLVLLFLAACDSAGAINVGPGSDLDELTDRVEALEASLPVTVVVPDVICEDDGEAVAHVVVPDVARTDVRALVHVGDLDFQIDSDFAFGIHPGDDIVYVKGCRMQDRIIITVTGPGVRLPTE